MKIDEIIRFGTSIFALALALGTGCSSATVSEPSASSLGQALSCTESAAAVATGAVTSNGVITRSLDFSEGYSSIYEGWRAFDGSNSTMWLSGLFQTPAWLGYEWTDGSRKITTYAITFSNGSLTTRAPKDFSLQGWDGTAWVVLDERQGESNWRGVERRLYSVERPGYYAKYRLNISDDNDPRDGVVVASIGKLELFECDCPSTQQVPAMTDASTPAGSVWSSGDYDFDYAAWKAFDHDSASMWISAVYQSPAWLAYSFADGPRTITSYAIRFVNGSLTTRAPKDFTLEGWNGQHWDILDSRQNETQWAGIERREYSVASPGSYYQYRLNIADDNDSRPGVVAVSIGTLELITQACESVTSDWNALLQRWHRDSTQSTETFDVFVPYDTPVLQQRFVPQMFFGPGNEFETLVLAPNDAHYLISGTYSRDGAQITTTTAEDPADPVVNTLEVLELTPSLLRIRR